MNEAPLSAELGHARESTQRQGRRHVPPRQRAGFVEFAVNARASVRAAPVFPEPPATSHTTQCLGVQMPLGGCFGGVAWGALEATNECSSTHTTVAAGRDRGQPLKAGSGRDRGRRDRGQGGIGVSP